MKRLAIVLLAISCALAATGSRGSATPFSDVPANHWAYQALQSLAADGLIEGYGDGRFKGDRSLTRYEMAVLVARVLAKIQADGAGYASKADLDKLQKLVDALKDELDSLGVRVANVEDALGELDRRTKVAQALQIHGNLNHQFTMSTPTQTETSIVNGTGVAQTVYSSGPFATPAVANPGAAVQVDPFVDAFIRTDETNSPLDQSTTGTEIRYDDRLTLSYAVSDNLTVSLPMHILNYEYGGEFTPGAQFVIQPDIVVNIAHAGALTNFYVHAGDLDDLLSSRLGLTFRAPDASQQGPGFEYPTQPYQVGVEVGGVLNGLTDFQLSFSRLDDTFINTSPGILGQGSAPGFNNYLTYYTPVQTGYTQIGAPASTSGSQQSNSFTAGNTPLTQVFLTFKAVAGTVFISQFDGASFNNAGVRIGGPAGIAAPGFTYNEALNAVVFSTPLPVGSTITITYVGLGATDNTTLQRYELNGRLNEHIKGLPGAEVGLSFNRIFDTDNLSTTNGVAVVGQPSPSGFGLVSDTVFGLDFQVPLPFGRVLADRPVLFGEGATSSFSPNYQTVASVTDSAAVVGLKLKLGRATASLQYQSIGKNFLDGAPQEFFGNAPALYSASALNYFPGFFGFGNNLAINQQFDALNGTTTSKNPNLTYIYPLFNPFEATGSSFFSAFAPNSQGLTANARVPFSIGGLQFNGRLLAQHLTELTPNSPVESLYGALLGIPPSNVKMTLDHLEAGVQFNAPILGKAIGFNLTGSGERLARLDTTPFGGAGVPALGAGGLGYVPFNPATQTIDGGSAAAAALTAGSVAFFPNYVNVYHTTLAANASIPLNHVIVLDAGYNAQYYYGADGTTLASNIAERKSTYLGSLTYAIPRTASTITFAYRNLRYQDFVLSTYNSTVNREDLNFNIRF